MPQVTYKNEFVVVPGTTPPSSPVLAVDNSRVFLQVCNNATGGGIVRIKFDQNFVVPTNQIWAFGFSATPTGGTWTVTDWTGAVTTALTYNESSNSLSTALNLLAGITAIGGVSVSGTMAAGFVITATAQVTASTLAANGLLTVQTTLTNNLVQANAIQNITFSANPTAGTFELQDSLGNNTTPLPYNTTGAAIETALNLLAGINNSVSACTFNGITIAVTFGAGTLADGPVTPLVVVNNTLTSSAVLVNNVQTMYFEPLPMQGTFKLVFKGQTSAALAFGATALQIQTAFVALSTVGAGNCAVSGVNAQSGFSFAFEGTLADAPQPAIVVINGPDSQYGAVNGGTSKMFPNTNALNSIEKHVPLEIEIAVVQTVPGVGPTAVTSTVTTATAGVAPAAVTATFPNPQTNSIQVLGQAQVVDGLSIAAGQSATYSAGSSAGVPLGAMFIIGSTTGISVQINEG